MIDRAQICELPKKQIFPTHRQDVASWRQGARENLGVCGFSLFQDGKETLRLAGKGGIGVDSTPSNSKHGKNKIAGTSPWSLGQQKQMGLDPKQEETLAKA